MLRPPRVQADAKQTTDAVVRAMRSLGWTEIQVTEGEVRAIVVSPLFRFRDDATVHIKKAEGGTLHDARPASRNGKGDLGANAVHLKSLFAEVARLVSSR